MQTKKVLDERNRFISLLLFYKNSIEDEKFFIKNIKLCNDELTFRKSRSPEYFENSKNLNVQFEFFLKKFLENNSEQNKEKLRNKYLEIQKHKR